LLTSTPSVLLGPLLPIASGVPASDGPAVVL